MRLLLAAAVLLGLAACSPKACDPLQTSLINGGGFVAAGNSAASNPVEQPARTQQDIAAPMAVADTLPYGDHVSQRPLPSTQDGRKVFTGLQTSQGSGRFGEERSRSAGVRAHLPLQPVVRDAPTLQQPAVISPHGVNQSQSPARPTTASTSVVQGPGARPPADTLEAETAPTSSGPTPPSVAVFEKPHQDSTTDELIALLKPGGGIVTRGSRLADPPASDVPMAANALPDFPWPPPEPSARMQLPAKTFRDGPNTPTLATVEDRLVDGLSRADYTEHSFHRVPGGFAIVARLERMSPDGEPLAAEFRYTPPDQQDFSFATYIRSLFFASEGYYRLIAIVVTDEVYSATGPKLDTADADRLLRDGANRLPDQIRKEPFTPSHTIDILIYEFRKGALAGQVAAINPGRLPAMTHLQRTRIMPSLAGMP